MKKMMELPRSFDKTNIKTWIAANTAASIACAKVTFLYNKEATKNTNTIFTNSEGCSVTPAIVQLILDPWVT